jgi:hypothetical protein
VKEKISGTEKKVEKLLDSCNNNEKIINNQNHTIQDILDVIKKPNLQISGVEEGTKIETKGIENLFNEIIAENFPNIGKEMDSNT